MASKVHLDALIPRADFEIHEKQPQDIPDKFSATISELQEGQLFRLGLRKPDFQRETSEWTPQRVFGLVKTFLENDLIPSVILWKNRDLSFVIDGSHRLSALIAWVEDDYGDGERSQEFFGPEIPREQLDIAARTRNMINAAFGPYQDHLQVGKNPDQFGPETMSRALRLGTLTMKLQWVGGDSTKAEEAFKRINRQAAQIQPQELELIDSRKKPSAISSRAILRKGKGHQYWSKFAATEQEQIVGIATELHGLIFEPLLRYPIKSSDLPAGGADYSATSLRMVYDFMRLCAGPTLADEDVNGKRTVQYLERARRVMRRILSNDASSLGLHPAVYFYSWTGKQQPILFQNIAELVIDLDQKNKLREFTARRKVLEEFLLSNRSLVNQLVRKFGTKSSGKGHLRKFYEDVLAHIGAGLSADEIVSALMADKKNYDYLQPTESQGGEKTEYSTAMKSGLILRQLLQGVPKCTECGGLIPSQSLSVDHKKRIQEGGLATVANFQLTHPYCNTGVKEGRVHQEKKAGS